MEMKYVASISLAALQFLEEKREILKFQRGTPKIQSHSFLPDASMAFLGLMINRPSLTEIRTAELKVGAGH